jgi:hypothetical protein
MSFSADWLALRAPADDAARDAGLLAAAVDWARAHDGCRILDLGSGTGATRRAFGNLVPGAHWWLADSDAALLVQAAGPDSTPLVVDLAEGLDEALAVEPQLVTASAFFDLAGAAWIETLVGRLAERGAALYAALNYDGQETWLPPHPEDASVAEAFAEDMGRDKGLGPALGGKAAAHLAACLHQRGFEVRTASSSWHLRARHDAALIAALAKGTARAADASADWLTARGAASHVTIGHIDLWAVPAG